MPLVKRKRKHSLSSPAKRRKSNTAKPSADPIYADDSDTYDVKAILESDGENFKVDWQPDRNTGQIYSPEWIPKDNVTADLRQEWEQNRASRPESVKRRKPGRPKGSTKSRNSLPQNPVGQVSKTTSTGLDDGSEADTEDVQPPRRGKIIRRRRTIESSPIPNEEARGADSDVQEIPEQSTPAPGPSSVRFSVDLQSKIQAQYASSSAQGPTLTRRFPKRIRIRVSPLSTPAKARYQVGSSPLALAESSPFPSSQVISGTAPQQDDPPTQSQPSFVDSAAAPNLTQQHSQYQQGQDTSKSTEDTTGSAVITNSSAEPLDSAPTHHQNKGPIIPDSQSLGESDSYVPTTQEASGAESHQAEAQAHPLTESDLPTSSLDQIQAVPESSASPRAGSAVSQGGNSTQSIIKVARYIPFIDDISSIEEDDDDRGTPAPAQVSPEPAVSSISSRSSPPPTESPSQTESSQIDSQKSRSLSQLLESQLQASAGDSYQAAQHSSQALRQVIDSDQWSQNQQTSQASSDTGHTASISTSSTESASQDSLSRIREEQQSQSVKDQPSPAALAASAPSLFGPALTTTSTSQRSSSRFLTLVELPLLHTNSTPPVAAGGSSDTSPIEHLEQARQDLIARTTQSPQDSSSLIASAPSQYPDTFRSAPPRPATPSNLSSTPLAAMTRQSPEKTLSVPEALAPITEKHNKKIEAIMARVRRSPRRLASPAGGREGRSPSAVPAVKAVPVPTEEENRTSEKYPTLVPEDAPPTLRRGSTVVRAAELPVEQVQESGNVDSNQHIVPITLSGHQRDQYKQTLQYARGFIEHFETRLWPEGSPGYTKATALVEKLRLVIQHPDLLNEETFTQAQMEPDFKANWDQTCSAKFRFLHQLLDRLRDQSLHIVIEYTNPRLGQILDNFLTGNGIRHQEGSSSQDMERESALLVTFCSSQAGLVGAAHADLVIVLDSPLALPATHRKGVRICTDGKMAPLLALVVPKSVEHIERCMPQLPPAQKMSILICTIVLHRKDAGSRVDPMLDPTGTANSIADFLTLGDGPQDWPLGSLEDIALEEPTLTPETSSGDESTQASIINTAIGLKRSRDGETSQDQHASKRSRLTSDDEQVTADEHVTTINPQELDITHVSDSVEQSQKIALSQHMADMQVLKSEHRMKEIQMQQSIDEVQGRLNEHIKALEDLQFQYEDRRVELLKTRTERDTATQQLAAAQTAIAARQVTIDKLKAERVLLSEQLKDAKSALADHTNPERAAFEALKMANATLEAQRAKLEARYKSQEADLAYARQLYQDASSKAQEHASSNMALEAQVAELTKKADGEQARAQKFTREHQSKELIREIRRLKTLVKDREHTLGQRDEELTRFKEAQRGRMGTRGSSVPRSPARLGSPLRLDPPPRSVAGGLGGLSGAGSRQNSPAPGMGKRHPLGRG